MKQGRCVRLLNISGGLRNNWQTIANSFSHYFLTIAYKIIDNNGNDKMGQSDNSNNPQNYKHQILKHPFPNIKFNYTQTNEIENIYETLKNKTSHSYDEISLKILKLGAPFIGSPLTYNVISTFPQVCFQLD
jgi:hypothetical protein